MLFFVIVLPSIHGKTFSINVSASLVCYFVHRSPITSRFVLFISPSSAPYTITRSGFNLISISVFFFNGNRIRVSTIHDVKWAQRSSVSERFPRKNVCFFWERSEWFLKYILHPTYCLTGVLIHLFVFTYIWCLSAYIFLFLFIFYSTLEACICR